MKGFSRRLGKGIGKGEKARNLLAAVSEIEKRRSATTQSQNESGQ
jgi:hypothetical protein